MTRHGEQFQLMLTRGVGSAFREGTGLGLAYGINSGIIGHMEKEAPTLRPVWTAASEFSPAPITDEEAAAMFRAALNLFRIWNITDEEAATLLDLPVRSYRRW